MSEHATFRSEAFAEDLEELDPHYQPGATPPMLERPWQRMLASLPLLAVLAQVAVVWVGA